jgi:ATP-dependent DNA ligase
VDNIADLDAEDQIKVRALAAERGLVLASGPVANPTPLIPSGRTKSHPLTNDLLPMLAGKAFQDVPSTGFSSFAEPKLDGWRAIVHITRTGVVRLYGGRNGSEYTGRVPYIEEALAHLPPDTVLDGELVSPMDWGMVQSIMTTQQPHRPTPESPAVQLYVFDMLRLDGKDIRGFALKDRRKLVETKSIYQCSNLVAPTMLVPATQESLVVALEHGFEGLVLKDPDSRYVNKRSDSWAKVKPQQTAEARIIGFKAGKPGGAWDGMVGAFEIELRENGAHTTIKCGTDARHIEATEHPERWIGAVIEIKHHGMLDSGKPRHPQFLRRRLDLERRAG